MWHTRIIRNLLKYNIMCAKTYRYRSRFDKVIIKIIWCSLFALHGIYPTVQQLIRDNVNTYAVIYVFYFCSCIIVFFCHRMLAYLTLHWLMNMVTHCGAQGKIIIDMYICWILNLNCNMLWYIVPVIYIIKIWQDFYQCR